jgi:hypothetical protein
MKPAILTFAFFSLLFLFSCKKPGIGGDASITGYVHVQKWNSTFTQFISAYQGKDLYVYIVYGDHAGYDKRIKTDYAGQFEFPYLYKGDYTVYVYSRDSSFADPSGNIALLRRVKISKRTEKVNLDTLLIFQ